MNEIESYQAQLPDTLEDLSQFVLVNEERVQALRAQIRAIKKVNLAKEVYEQKLAEAQEIGQITVEAAQKMGELLLQIQKVQGKRTDLTSVTNDTEVKTKTQITQEMGMSHKQVLDYQQMAQNPEAVQAAIQKAIENGDVVSRNQVMKEIRSAKEELKRQLAEKEKKISELENRAPVVKIKEVVPTDYEDMKRSVENYQKEAVRIQQEKKRVSEKNKELTERIRDLESRKDIDALRKKVKEEAGYFAIRTYNYIQENGGCVWIFQKIDELSDKERKDFIDAIHSADAFIKQMIENLGGYGIE